MTKWQHTECRSYSQCGGLAGIYVQMYTRYHIQKLSQVLGFPMHNKEMELIIPRYRHLAELGLF